MTAGTIKGFSTTYCVVHSSGRSSTKCNNFILTTCTCTFVPFSNHDTLKFLEGLQEKKDRLEKQDKSALKTIAVGSERWKSSAMGLDR